MLGPFEKIAVAFCGVILGLIVAAVAVGLVEGTAPPAVIVGALSPVFGAVLTAIIVRSVRDYNRRDDE